MSTNSKFKFAWIAVALACLACSLPIYADELDCGIAAKPKMSHFVKTQIKADKPNSLKKRRSFNVSRVELAYPAKVIALKGDVQLIERNKAGASIALQKDMSLQLNDVIETGSKSFVSVRYGDGSINVLPPNAKIRLNQASKTVPRIELLKGEVESHIKKSPNATRNTFVIMLPTASIGVRGTHFRVKEDKSDFNVEVEDGIVRVARRNACIPAQLVSANMTAHILTNSTKTEMSVLLPAPELLNPDQAQRKSKNMTFVLSPLAGAAKYRLQIAKDSQFLDLQAEAYSDTTSIEVANDDLQDGFYYVRVSGVNNLGLEGQTAEHLFLRNRVAQLNRFR